MNRLSPPITDTLENPAKRGQSRLALGPFASKNMVTCWQQGRRVLMHSSEVAKMMRKESSSSSLPMKRCDGSKPCMDYRVSHRQTALTRGPMQPGNDEGREADDKKKTASFDLTPPPIRPRGRSLAQNESWQKLAKEIARAANHPPHCHKKQCRRSKKCEGGNDACYLREFETVDVLMQRHVLPAIKRGAAARDAVSASPAASASARFPRSGP